MVKHKRLDSGNVFVLNTKKTPSSSTTVSFWSQIYKQDLRD